MNTAAYGAGAWNIDATAYTPAGQVDWALTAGNRARAVATAQAGDPQALPVANTVARAALLRTENTYDAADPGLVLESFGPLADAVLADGTTRSARAHTKNRV